jgi:hypothetical protein
VCQGLPITSVHLSPYQSLPTFISYRKSPSTDVEIRTFSCLREQTVSQTSISLSRISVTDKPTINPSLICTTPTSSSYSLSSSSSPPRTNTRNSVALGGLVVSVLATGVQTWPRTMDFKGDKIRSTPSFGGEVKPSVPCRRFTAR